jgi:hypothetical protein
MRGTVGVVTSSPAEMIGSGTSLVGSATVSDEPVTEVVVDGVLFVVDVVDVVDALSANAAVPMEAINPSAAAIVMIFFIDCVPPWNSMLLHYPNNPLTDK